MSLLVKGGRVIDPVSGFEGEADVLCAGGKIAAVGANLDAAADCVLDATGSFVFPALLDLHAHTGEPGHEPRETLATFAAAAVRGGFAAAVLMPDTHPVRQDAADVRALIAAGAGLPVRLLAAASLTREREGSEPTEWQELVAAGAVALGDCRPVADTSLVRRALLYLRPWSVPLLADCFDPYLAKNASAREGYYGTVFGLRGVPAEAEELMVEREIILARLTGGRVHIQHVTTKEAVRRIARAKEEGVAVTAEVSWLHLLKTDAALERYDTSLKVWPPLGNEEDRAALLDAVRTGVIDAIVSDHTPFTFEEKDVEFDLAPAGAAGAELVLPALWSELVNTGFLSAAQLVRALTAGPAQVLGQRVEGVREGAPADLVVLDPAAAWTVTRDALASQAANHPYLGERLTARVRAVVLGGRVQYEAER